MSECLFAFVPYRANVLGAMWLCLRDGNCRAYEIVCFEWYVLLLEGIRLTVVNDEWRTLVVATRARVVNAIRNRRIEFIESARRKRVGCRNGYGNRRGRNDLCVIRVHLQDH